MQGGILGAEVAAGTGAGAGGRGGKLEAGTGAGGRDRGGGRGILWIVSPGRLG
jgi:hypothetical protein